MIPSGSIARHPSARFIIPAAALLLCCLQLALTFPGEMIDDSVEQLRQAMSHQFGDWHPPAMALVWSWLIGMTGNPGSLLIWQQALHWLGFGLVADGCQRANMPKRAWLILAAGAFPLFLFYNKVLVKDVEMAAAFIAAFGVCCWFLLVRKSIPWWAVLLAAVLLLYGTLTRTNAVFALGPLVCVFFARGRRFNYAKIAGFSVIVALLAVPLSNAINHRVIGAKPQDSLQSLQIYDLVGIEVRSGDNRVLGADAAPIGALKSCYTSYWWDTFSAWGTCASLRPRLEYVSDMESTNPELVAERGVLWRKAILAHPLDYLAHRLSYFNSSIYFLVPALHFRFSKSAVLQPPNGRIISERDIHLDYLKKNLFFWPVFWLAVGCCALAFLEASADMPAVVSFARLLVSSGLLYSGAYVLIGVATDVRYYYWPIMSIFVGVILASPDIRLRWHERPIRAKLAASLLVAVLVLGYAARLAGANFA